MKNVMIVVDMLNDFVNKDGALYFPEAREIIKPIKEKFKNSNIDELIYLCDSHEPNDLEFEKFPPHCIKHTWGANIIGQLAPTELMNPCFVVEKTRYSGFYNTELDDYLKRIKPDMVIVVGVCTSICVMDTVGDLANRDYNVTVPSDCVADFDNAMHDFSIERMKNIYGANIE